MKAFPGSVLFGAFAICFFAFLFLTRLTKIIHERNTSDFILVSVLLISLAGVAFVNSSLYNFNRVPTSKKAVKLIEEGDRLALKQLEKMEDTEGKVIFEMTKKFWIPKMFAINFLLFAVALSAGCLLGKKVEKASHIFAIIALGAVMDYWSVSSGVTKNIISSKLNCYYFLFNWTVAGSDNITYPLIGSTDFLFIVLFLFLARKFDLGILANSAGLFAGVALSILSASVLGYGIPALPFIGLSVFLINFRKILPDRNELLQIIVGSVVIYTVFSVAWKFKKN